MCAASESGKDPKNKSFADDIYSYVSSSAASQPLSYHLEIGAGESIIGIYFNDPTHFVAFTGRAFYWVRKEREVICPYSTILRTKLPDTAEEVSDERAIEIALKNGDFLFLPIFNDSDGIEDIYGIFEMLNQLISASINIKALEDMIAKLNFEFEQYKLDPDTWQTPFPVKYFESVIAFLYNCLDQCAKGESVLKLSNEEFLNIDQPKTWQLIAQILLAPKTFSASWRPRTESDHES